MLYVSGQTFQDIIETKINFERYVHNLTIDDKFVIFAIEMGRYVIWVRYTIENRIFTISKTGCYTWGDIEYVEAHAIEQREWHAIRSEDSFLSVVKQLCK